MIKISVKMKDDKYLGMDRVILNFLNRKKKSF
jgi:hypothetical protein